MKPGIKTRNWSTPEGYRYLAPWSNAVLLRFLIREFTKTLPRSEYRAKTQVDDAARSTVANIEEGWKRPDRKAYLEFLGFSQASLEEVKGDIRRLHQDGFLKSKKDSTLANLGINLKEFKGLLEEDKGNTLLDILYSPLKSLKGDNLTFEVFMELTNKTDYLLRQLVTSLEKTYSKENAMGPMQRWQWQQMQNQHQQEKNLDKETKEEMRQQGKIFTSRGYMDINEAARLGLKEI